MRRQIPGLHLGQKDSETNLDGLFLVQVERAAYRWHRQKSFLAKVHRPRAGALSAALVLWTVVLHGPSALETELVSSRLRLRHRTAQSRPG